MISITGPASYDPRLNLKILDYAKSIDFPFGKAGISDGSPALEPEL